MIDIYDYLGLFGVTFTVYGYARLQWNRDYAKKMRYSLLNFVGSCLIALSLLQKWNLSAFVVNAIMASISLYGVYRCAKYMIRERYGVTWSLWAMLCRAFKRDKKAVRVG